MTGDKFVEIYQDKIQRPGADKLLAWLQKSDFFTAPASTRFHLCCSGGLVEHSINVYDRLKQFLFSEYAEGECPYTAEIIAIVSLLHDVCKANYYEAGWKNQKTYDEEKIKAAKAKGERVKHDEAGDFIWEMVPTYTVNERFVYGHGEKSVYIIRSFMGLSTEEASAIRYHMGPWREGEGSDAGKVFSRYPLAFFLHMADEAASFLDESEEA